MVGVAPNLRQRTQAAEPDPMVYLPFAGAPPASSVLLLRGELARRRWRRRFARRLEASIRSCPCIGRCQWIRRSRRRNWPGRVSEALLNSIAFVAVCLAGIGLYAVMAHAVLPRTREIGIRVAGPSDVVSSRSWRDLPASTSRSRRPGGGCVIGFTKLIDQGTGQGSSPFRLNDPLTLCRRHWSSGGDHRRLRRSFQRGAPLRSFRPVCFGNRRGGGKVRAGRARRAGRAGSGRVGQVGQVGRVGGAPISGAPLLF